MNDRFDKKLLQYIQNNEGNGMQFMAEYYNQNKGRRMKYGLDKI